MPDTYIALIAHDARKVALAEWVGRHIERVERWSVVATGTTGRVIAERYPMLTVQRVASGPQGGDQQIGALIVEGRIGALVFFVDPLSPMPHDVDVKALMRLAILYNVPAAFNERTADAVLATLPVPKMAPTWSV
jgi:methylglyoxal synthase